jgi:predicted RNA-binding Zn-ribbon protein involved in translation (DUF1610 family)
MRRVLAVDVLAQSNLKCPTCGWTGTKDALVKNEVEFEATDLLRNAISTVFASRPQHKYEYRCPKCGRLLATQIESLFSYWDEWLIED